MSEIEHLHDDAETPGARLQRTRIAAGFKRARDAAEHFGWSLSTYSQHEGGHRSLRRAAVTYARAFEIPVDWLLYGDAAPPRRGRVAVPRAPDAPVTSPLGSGALRAGLRSLVWVASAEGAAGEPVPFSASVLEQLGVRAATCRVAQIAADAPAGDIGPGDWVLYDTADCDPFRPGLFAVATDGGAPLIVLHLSALVGTSPRQVHVAVRGPHPHQYTTQQSLLKISGRVRWVGRAV